MNRIEAAWFFSVLTLVLGLIAFLGVVVFKNNPYNNSAPIIWFAITGSITILSFLASLYNIIKECNPPVPN